MTQTFGDADTVDGSWCGTRFGLMCEIAERAFIPYSRDTGG